jgi:hypothetical protein
LGFVCVEEDDGIVFGEGDVGGFVGVEDDVA